MLLDGGAGSFTVIGDVDPIGDICSSSKRIQVTMGGRNIGDLLNEANVSWGWFEEGFDVTGQHGRHDGLRPAHTSAITGLPSKDYIAHHEPFQYYPSTANPKHARPGSTAAIGPNGDAANHQYDLADFFAAARCGALPRRVVPQASGLSERPRRLLGPNRRAGVSRAGVERSAAAAGVEEHRRPADVGRLGWLVRPLHGSHRQLIGGPDRCARWRRRLW